MPAERRWYALHGGVASRGMPIRFLHVAVAAALVFVLVYGLDVGPHGVVDGTLAVILAVVGLVCVILDLVAVYAPGWRRPPA